MEIFDVNSLINIDAEYKKRVDSAIGKYKGEWNDNIHVSYQLYIRRIQEHSQNIHSIKCRIEELKAEIEDLNINDIINEADNLCREAESI